MERKVAIIRILPIGAHSALSVGWWFHFLFTGTPIMKLWWWANCTLGWNYMGPSWWPKKWIPTHRCIPRW